MIFSQSLHSWIVLIPHYQVTIFKKWKTISKLENVNPQSVRTSTPSRNTAMISENNSMNIHIYGKMIPRNLSTTSSTIMNPRMKLKKLMMNRMTADHHKKILYWKDAVLKFLILIYSMKKLLNLREYNRASNVSLLQ